MSIVGTFPFGQPLRSVEQKDKRPKRVFVLGVYASAVHARWVGTDSKTRINAVAVAPEPEIFWKGENAEELINEIVIPKAAGHLVPASSNLNGPSGKALDEHFLEPLNVNRGQSWLCDLVPHSCMNGNQAIALKNRYFKFMGKLGLPKPDWPTVPVELANKQRQDEIKTEVQKSKAEVIITLGDQPLKWFTKNFGSKARLKAYGDCLDSYGRLHPIIIGGRKISLLPLVHPRQAARLGAHSKEWANLHDKWVTEVASEILGQKRIV